MFCKLWALRKEVAGAERRVEKPKAAPAGSLLALMQSISARCRALASKCDQERVASALATGGKRPTGSRRSELVRLALAVDDDDDEARIDAELWADEVLADERRQRDERAALAADLDDDEDGDWAD
jgi:hypothetical protein